MDVSSGDSILRILVEKKEALASRFSVTKIALFGSFARGDDHADSDVDILTGHNAGLPALGVLWGFRGESELTAAGADALAAKPEDILAYLHQH